MLTIFWFRNKIYRMRKQELHVVVRVHPQQPVDNTWVRALNDRCLHMITWPCSYATLRHVNWTSFIIIIIINIDETLEYETFGPNSSQAEVYSHLSLHRVAVVLCSVLNRQNVGVESHIQYLLLLRRLASFLAVQLTCFMQSDSSSLTMQLVHLSSCILLGGLQREDSRSPGASCYRTSCYRGPISQLVCLWLTREDSWECWRVQRFICPCFLHYCSENCENLTFNYKL